MASKIAVLSISQSYVRRVTGINYVFDGVQTDPRGLFAVEFQLLAPDSDTFDTWQAGLWETHAPTNGPYAATCIVGAGQAAQLNPGQEGIYELHMRMNGSAETPSFVAETVRFSAP